VNTIKVGVIGLGKMGLLHSSILNTMPQVEVVAICDRSSILLKVAKKLFKKSNVINDVSKITNSEIDAVFVTTPIPSHYGIIKNLFAKQIVENVFVEKTLASSWDEAKKICELTNEVGVNLVGFMNRFSVTFKKAKNILTEKLLGELSYFDAYAFSSDFSKVQRGSKKSALRGGVLRDLGSHVIDLAAWFFGDFEVTSASIESIVDVGSEDSANFAVADLGLTGHFRISWCADKYRMPAFGLTVIGDKGTMKVDDYSLNLNLKDGSAVNWFKQDLNDSVNFLLGNPEYYREDETFVKSILTGKKAEPSFKTASRTDYIIDQVKKEAIYNRH
jgi:predicted dehydrogenase